MSSENGSDGSTSSPSLRAQLLLLLIEAYRLLLAPLVGGHCRFWPSCSVYASEAIQTHGALRGSQLSILRLLRCHPFCHGGVDPVP